MAIIFALIAMVGWGAGDVLVAVLSRKIGSKNTFFWWLVAGFIIGLVYLPFAGPVNNVPMLAAAFFLNVFASIGTVAYIRALEIGNASLTGTLGGAFPILTVPLSVILFHENLTTVKIIGILFIFSGLILSSLKKGAIKEIKSRKIFSDKGVVYALIACIVWGIYWAVVRYPIESIGWFWTGFTGTFVFVFLPVIGFVKGIPVDNLRTKKIIPLILFTAMLTIGGGYAFNIGVTYGYSSIVAPIAGLSPVLFVVLSGFVFKDKLTNRQKLGIGLALAGIILIAVSSG